MLIKAFENGVEINTTNSCDRLYFFEQHTKGHAKDLVRSFQHINPEPRYIRAKALLKEHFRDEQKVTSACMGKALSWPPIKAEDVKSCWNTASSEAAVIPWRMCSIFWICICLPTCWASLKKLPYKLRERWRSHACELQEQHNWRAKFTDIADFIERQVKILMDPVFGNIQDSQPITIYKGTNKPKSQLRSGNKGSSFANTVGPMENKHQSARKEKKIK